MENKHSMLQVPSNEVVAMMQGREFALASLLSKYAINKPKKRRTRALLEVLRSDDYAVLCGNQITRNHNGTITYYYRNTLIYMYNVYTGEHNPIECDYEDSKSTQHQRKEIIKAIEEFERILQSIGKAESVWH